MREKTNSPGATAFSLLEMLVAMTILLAIIALSAAMLNTIEQGWSRIRSRTMEFRDARAAFETIANRLSQARIDTYWDYEMDNQGLPESYQKASHLHFVAGPASALVPESFAKGEGHAVFFQAPFGMSRDSNLKGLSSLMNGWGYFTGYGSNANWQPEFLKGKKIIPERFRYRLFEYHLPTERLRLHSDTKDGIFDYEWIYDQIEVGTVSILAENVIAFVVQPTEAVSGTASNKIAENYRFDSRAFDISPGESNADRAKHEVPPIIRLTMVVVAEADFAKIQKGTEIPTEFQIQSIAPFAKAKDYQADINALEKHLQEKRIDYRVFTTAISMRSAKFTGEVGGGTP